MQAESHHIYKKVFEKSGEDLDLITAIGDIIQKETAANLRRPENLIVKLRGVGSWYLRKKRMQSSYDNLSKYEGSKFREETEQYVARLKARLEDYERFLEKKRQVKEAKHEYYSKKSSESNSEECTGSTSSLET